MVKDIMIAIMMPVKCVLHMRMIDVLWIVRIRIVVLMIAPCPNCGEPVPFPSYHLNNIDASIDDLILIWECEKVKDGEVADEHT
jgi:hypothetical protein